MNADNDPRQVLERLIRERKDDYAGLSRMLGRNAAYIHQFIHRGSPKRLREEDRKMLARYFRIDERLLGAPGAAPHDAGPLDGLIEIPRLDVRASAGPGAFDGAEGIVANLGFRRAWLERFCRAEPEDLSVIEVHGDSMFPTLSDGDEIMVNRSDAAGRLRDGIYVLRLEDSLVVKRLSVNPVSKRATVSSDNPAYPSWPDLKPSHIDVIGRVVWVGRKVA
jgi:hypothetical protein